MQEPKTLGTCLQRRAFYSFLYDDNSRKYIENKCIATIQIECFAGEVSCHQGMLSCSAWYRTVVVSGGQHG